MLEDSFTRNGLLTLGFHGSTVRPMEYNLRTVRLGDDVWEAVQAHAMSANELLRLALGMAARPIRKVSKKDAHVAALRASDPLAEVLERTNIEHGNMELPSGGSVALNPPVARPERVEKERSSDVYRARGIRPKGDKTR